MPQLDLTPSSDQKPARIPKRVGGYKMRFTREPVFHIAQSGGGQSYKMLAEIIEPPHVLIDGKEFKVAGVTFEFYCSLQQNKTFMLEAIHKALGFPWPKFDVDDSGLPVGLSYTGREFFADCISEETPELIDGEPNINPVTGEAVMRYNKRIARIFS